MRIVGGHLKGRRLAAPSSTRIRPTTDRTRESLFNILSNRIEFEGIRVIDLFAGTGALGFEAVSRGASFCLFVEESAEGRGLLRANIETLGLLGNTRIYRRDATRLGEPGTLKPFDLAFLDPPYNRELGQKAMSQLLAGGWLNPGATVILEEHRDGFPGEVAGYVCEETREYGETIIGIFHPETGEDRD